MSTAATLHQVRAALKTALQSLLTTATPAGPLASVVSFAGKAAHVNLSVAGNLPGVVLAFEGERYPGKASVRTLAGGMQRNVSESSWVVFVMVEQPGDNADVADDTATDSLDTCTQSVLTKLNGLLISGLLGNSRVEADGVVPGTLEAGMVVHECRFVARRELATTADTYTSNTLSIRGNVNLDDQADAEPNPVDVIAAP